MKNVYICVLLFAVTFFTESSAAASQNCTGKKPATIPSGATYIEAPGCPQGPTYNTDSGQHAHCWGHCGYICEPKKAATSAKPCSTCGGVQTTKKPTPKPVCTSCEGKTTKAPTCTKKPNLPAGCTWVASPGCPKGDTYNTDTDHCHCWSHCGYICNPKAAATTKKPAATTKKPAATTKKPTTAGTCKKQPKLPPGSKWVADPGCNNGPTYDSPSGTKPKSRSARATGYHCHCWGHCGYICDPKGGTAKTTKKPGKTTTSKATSPCPFGGVWIPPKDPTYRCICQSFSKKPYYLCKPGNGTDGNTTTTTTMNPGNVTENSTVTTTTTTAAPNGTNTTASTSDTAATTAAASTTDTAATTAAASTTDTAATTAAASTTDTAATTAAASTTDTAATTAAASTTDTAATSTAASTAST